MTDAIEFDAVVYKVQTLVDQGLRITFDLPETALIAAAQLMAVKREGLVLHIQATAEHSPMPIGGETGNTKIMKRVSKRSEA